MAMIGMRELLDQARKGSAEDRASLTAAAAGAATPINPLGLRFVARERVVDLVTGQSAIVQAGDRDPQTTFQRYRVQLADRKIVYRTERELEPIAEPPAGSR